MGRKILAILIVTIGLAVIIGLVWFIFLNNSLGVDINQEQVVAPDDIASDAPSIITGQELTPTTPVVSTYKIDTSLRETGVEDLKMIAAAFAERFGSYSNHSNYSNIVDLQLFMTPAMQDWSKTYIDRLRSENPSTSYYGISTYALSSQVISYDEKLGRARIMVVSQRKENSDDLSQEKLLVQNIAIDLVKLDERWFLSGAFWQKD